MRFTFDIDEFYSAYSNMSITEDEFKSAIMANVAEVIADRIWNDEVGYYENNGGNIFNDLSYSVEKKIDNMLKENKDKIIELVVERVTESIAKKKQIIELTPKARELVSTNKENEKYFCELIDKAIAKKFKG